MITTLTPEQEALIPVYREKWRAIALSTERIDRQKAREFIRVAYTFIGRDTPQIIFCDSPYAAIAEMLVVNSSHNQLGKNQANYVIDRVNHQLYNLWNQRLLQPISSPERKHFLAYLEKPESDLLGEDPLNLLGLILRMNESELVWKLWSKKVDANSISSFDWMYTISTFDFFTSELDCYYDPEVYQIVEWLVTIGGIIFPFEQVCFFCDRPTKLTFDDQGRLHADKEPAIEFADGFCVYAQHGELITEPDGS